MNMLDVLREEAVAAFHRFAKEDPLRRDHLWDAYVSARERFLREFHGSEYRPLRVEFLQ